MLNFRYMVFHISEILFFEKTEAKLYETDLPKTNLYSVGFYGNCDFNTINRLPLPFIRFHFFYFHANKHKSNK